MIRYVFLDAVFFLLPFAAYAGWLVFTRGSLSNVEDWQGRTIAFLAIVGAGFLVAALAVFASYQIIPPGGTYVPAHMEDGHLVPGHVDPGPANPG
jgi:hypothetical protein